VADCEWIIVCDYAFRAERGKLGMIGVFDTVFVKQLPTKHSRAAICFNIVGEPGEHVEIKLEVIGPTGQVVLKTNTEFTLPDAGSAQGLIDVQGLVLSELGRYAVQVDLGESVPRQAWLTAKLVEP
jgi:hypothetical protein